MSGMLQLPFLGLSFLLIPLLVHAEQLEVNGRALSWQKDGDDQSASLQLTYTPYFTELYRSWSQLRVPHGEQDPLGRRDYWRPEDRRVFGDFSVRLSPQDPSGWLKFVDGVDPDVLFAIYPTVLKFADTHRSSLQAKAEAIRKNLQAGGLELASNELYFRDKSGHPAVNEETRLFFSLRDFLLPTPTGFLANKLALAKDYGNRYSTLPARTPVLKLPISPVTLRKPTLIVTHASERWDPALAAKAEIDRLVARFRSHRDPVVFLMDEDMVNDKAWYTSSRNPTYALFSRQGEHDLSFTSSEITVVGGYFGACQTISVADAIIRHFRLLSGPIRVHLPMRGIFSHRDRRVMTLAEIFDSQPNDFLSFVKSELFLSSADGTPGKFKSDELMNGRIDLSSYQFRLFLNGEPIESLGSGARIVELRFE